MAKVGRKLIPKLRGRGLFERFGLDFFSRERRQWLEALDEAQLAALELQRQVEKRKRRRLKTPPAPNPVRKLQRKPAQEEILRKVHEKYPDGDVGDASVAEVCRKIAGKGYNPSWESVNRALGRDRKK